MKLGGVIGTCVATTLVLSLHTNSTKLRQFGANPTGMAVFDTGGRYIITVMRSDRAKYASNTLWQGTPEENKARRVPTESLLMASLRGHFAAAKAPRSGTVSKSQTIRFSPLMSY
jgi:hypothetical protein